MFMYFLSYGLWPMDDDESNLLISSSSYRPKNSKMLSIMHQEGKRTRAKICKREKPSKRMKSDGGRRWDELDPDILNKIFSLVPYEELFLNVCAVCTSWEAACFDYSFWSRNILDLTAATAGFGYFSRYNVVYSTNPVYHPSLGPSPALKKFDSLDKYEQLCRNLSTLLRRMMYGNDARGRSLEEWRMSVRTLIIPYDLPIPDEHLVYIAERLPGLECLSLLGITRMTSQGFERAAKNWKHLKVVHFGPISYGDDLVSFPIYDRFIKVLGKYCQDLEALHIHQRGFILNSVKCQFIAHNLPGLKKLLFEVPYVFRDGIRMLLQMCHQLKNIDLLVGWFLVEEFDCFEEWTWQEGFTKIVAYTLHFLRQNDGKWVINYPTLFDWITPGLRRILDVYDNMTPVAELMPGFPGLEQLVRGWDIS